MAVTAPNVSQKASSSKGTRGRSCAGTCWKRPVRSFLTGPGPSGFAFTLYVMKFSWLYEDSSRRLRRAPRRRLVPKLAVREGAPAGSQPHHPGNCSACSPPDCDFRPPPSDSERSVRSFAQSPSIRMSATRSCGPVDDPMSTADLSVPILEGELSPSCRPYTRRRGGPLRWFGRFTSRCSRRTKSTSAKHAGISCHRAG